MEPAILSALIIGTASLASIIVAGIVACCRKQQNLAMHDEQSASTNGIIIEISESKIVTTEYRNGKKVITETKPSVKVQITANDNGQDGTNADNSSDGFDKNTIPILDPRSGSAVSSTTTSTAGTTTSSDSQLHISGLAYPSSAAPAGADQSVSHPPVINNALFAHTTSPKTSIFNINNINIQTTGTNITIQGLKSLDGQGNSSELQSSKSITSPVSEVIDPRSAASLSSDVHPLGDHSINHESNA